jgi:hypothetical protein
LALVDRHGYVIVRELKPKELPMSIDAHLTSLENKHRAIETEIEQELAHPSADTVKVMALKRKKLQLKDSINRLLKDVKSDHSVH